jgi:hypothetical protein
MKSFGQEFYPYESIRALKLAEKVKVSERHALVEVIAAQLPQTSEKTRSRIAAKIVQRYISGRRRIFSPLPHQQPFVRLIARSRHVPTQIELLYYRLAKIDPLVGSIARELFYPACLTGRPPDGLSANEFALRNGARLFSPSPLLTRTFILDYARTRWNFTSRATIDRSLRVLQGAGLIARERMTELHEHPTAYRLSEHNVSPVTFVYALYDEFLPHKHDPGFLLMPEAIAIADFARTLLLSPAQVAEHCETARRHQLLAQHNNAMRLVFGNLDVLVDALLAKAI